MAPGTPPSAADVAVVVCTLNSIASIEACLRSVRDAGAGELIVVDAASSDGTRRVAEELADTVLTDPGTGLGNARNVGIAATTKPLILNLGSDNVLPKGQLERMIECLETHGYDGVSARTRVEGSNYASRGLNAWRDGRFRPGPAAVIGTPTLFRGDMLRAHPYDPRRRFSDDSELCERWTTQFGSRFGISEAMVIEQGKATWAEVKVRCRMYGISDEEVYRRGSKQGWSRKRKAQSLMHPFRADLVTPVRNGARLPSLPFLAAFTAMRYAAWARTAARGHKGSRAS